MNPKYIVHLLTENIEINNGLKSKVIRLFRNPHSIMSIKDLIKLANRGDYDGRYYTIDPEDSIGYYGTGQFIEIEVPIKEMAPEDLALVTNLIIDDPNPTPTRITYGIKQAIEFGVPKQLIDKIIWFTNNKEKLISKEKPSEIICTVDGCLTKEMATVLKQIFPYVQDKGGQAQLLSRNIGPGELVAVYEYTPTDISDKYTITKVIKVSGDMPSLEKDQILKKHK